MSASHIPNLNTLRRGGGRGHLRARGRGPPGSDEDSHGTNDSSNQSSDSKDRVVQGTDNDASVSRLSAVNLGYIDDPFARALAPSTLETRRLPIINRGTYVRTAAIDRLVDRFLGQDQDQQKQIISLGAGSDTRVFRLLSSSSRRRNIVYHEIDFPVNTAAKIKAIRATPGLQSALGMDKSEEGVIVESGDALHSPAYHLHALDLRCLSKQDTPGQEPEPGLHLEGVDATLPTLLISECCLVYLSPAEADGVVDYFTKTLFPPKDSTATPLGLILYEPIRPDDPFGRTMVSNLAARGIQLQTLHRYASLDSQRERLQRHGFADGQDAADVDFLWERWVSESEKERVGGLEMLDEIEEWQLLARHYCVAWGWRGLNGWREIETPSVRDRSS